LPFKLFALYVINDDVCNTFVPVFDTFLIVAIFDPDKVKVELFEKSYQIVGVGKTALNLRLAKEENDG
jgi:hypothetical protein